jgi:hypothetical protein
MPKFKSKWADLVVEVGSIAVNTFEDLFHEYTLSKIKNPRPEKVIDISLIRWLANAVENALDKKDIVDGKINKKKLVIDEYIKLKPSASNPQFREILEDLIEDLHNTHQIKKIAQRTKLYHRVKSCCVSNDATK